MGYCGWAAGSAMLRAYHDGEWGVPAHEDDKQFEHLSLEVMQCGLSWATVLKKRGALRRAFADFNVDRVAAFTAADVERILTAEGVIRSRRKIEAVIGNAHAFRRVRAEYGSFSDYIWAFAGHQPILYEGHADGPVPAKNGLSETIARDLKARGFRYVGGVTVYAHLQACGVVNDHSRDCPRRAALLAAYPARERPRDRETLPGGARRPPAV